MYHPRTRVPSRPNFRIGRLAAPLTREKKDDRNHDHFQHGDQRVAERRDPCDRFFHRLRSGNIPHA